MIANAAGSGKQAIYRRWSSKAELVLDAFLAHAEAEVDMPRVTSTSLREQVAGFLRRTFDALAETGPAVRSLMATAQQDHAFLVCFRTRFIDPRRKSLKRVLTNAIAGGLLSADADVEVATIALYGAVWYRLLLDEPIDDAYADRLAAVIVGGLGGLN
jgi:AcrR family transcriptional regulator